MRVFVITSDGYLHAMKPFAYLFNKFWPDQQVEVCCHEVPYGLPGNFTCVSVGKQSDYTWSQAVGKFLEVMDTERFILLLEDYFLTVPPDIETIEWLWRSPEWGQRQLGRIGLVDDRVKFPYVPTDHDGVIRSIWKEPGTGKSLYNPNKFIGRLYLTSLQPAIWRTDFFLSCLRQNEDPWEFEEKGTKRLVDEDTPWELWGTTLHPLKYCNILKARKAFNWRPDRGMPPELWQELLEIPGMIQGAKA